MRRPARAQTTATAVPVQRTSLGAETPASETTAAPAAATPTTNAGAANGSSGPDARADDGAPAGWSTCSMASTVVDMLTPERGRPDP